MLGRCCAWFGTVCFNALLLLLSALIFGAYPTLGLLGLYLLSHTLRVSGGCLKRVLVTPYLARMTEISERAIVADGRLKARQALEERLQARLTNLNYNQLLDKED
jgi:hypothetical protein